MEEDGIEMISDSLIYNSTLKVLYLSGLICFKKIYF